MNGMETGKGKRIECAEEKGKKRIEKFPGALVSFYAKLLFAPPNVAVIDYRFVAQVMLQMFHARARLSFSLSLISLALTCSPNINQPTVLNGETLPQFSTIHFLLIRQAYLKCMSIRVVQWILYYRA